MLFLWLLASGTGLTSYLSDAIADATRGKTAGELATRNQGAEELQMLVRRRRSDRQRSGRPEEAVREALRSVDDPEIGMNIVELGFVYRIDVAPGRLPVEMTMTTRPIRWAI